MNTLRQTGKYILGLVLLLSIAGLGGSPAPDAQAQAAEHHAGLVLQFAGGSTRTYCLTFTGDSISGLDLLLKTGLEVKVEVYGSMGGQICKIGSDGCDYPEQPCACQSYGPGGVYWSYAHLKSGAWKSSGQGASTYKVRDGDVEGWAWSNGKGPNIAPSLAQLCSNLQLAQAEPTGTPSPQPPTSTLAPPEPTNTVQSTIAPAPPTSTPPAVASPSATSAPLVTPSPTPPATPSPTLATTEQPTTPATPTAAPANTPTDTPAPPPTDTPLDTRTPLDTATATSVPSDTPTVAATVPPTGQPTDTVAPAPPTATIQPAPTPTQTPTPEGSSPQAVAQMVAVGIALVVAGGLLLIQYVRTRGDG